VMAMLDNHLAAGTIFTLAWRRKDEIPGTRKIEGSKLMDENSVDLVGKQPVPIPREFLDEI